MKAAQDIVIAPVITEKSMIDAKNKNLNILALL